MTVSLDGHSITGHSSTASAAGTLTTSNGGDAILAVLSYEDGSTATSVSGISSTNTTGWTKLGSINWSTFSGRFDGLELWYGLAASSLSSESITATLANSIDAVNIHLIGLSSSAGAYSGSPLDGNAGALQTASHMDFSGFTSTTPTTSTAGSTSTDTSTGNLTTTATSGLLMAWFGSSLAFSGGQPGAGSTPSSLTLLDHNAQGGVHENDSQSEYVAFGSALSGQVINFAGTNIDWGVLAAAFVDPAAGPPPGSGSHAIVNINS